MTSSWFFLSTLDTISLNMLAEDSDDVRLELVAYNANIFAVTFNHLILTLHSVHCSNDAQPRFRGTRLGNCRH